MKPILINLKMWYYKTVKYIDILHIDLVTLYVYAYEFGNFNSTKKSRFLKK